MSQHDYSIANGSGAAVRGDINTALGAILTSNSGPSAPTVTAPFMPWYDTVNGVLWERNAADSAWVPAAPGRLLNIQKFDAAGSFTYTRTPGARFGIVEMMGGGAGGAGSGDSATGNYSFGSPGGHGGYLRFTVPSLPASVAVVVGAAGAQGAAYSNGTSGGNTIFGTSGDSWYAVAGAGQAGTTFGTTSTLFPRLVWRTRSSNVPPSGGLVLADLDSQDAPSIIPSIGGAASGISEPGLRPPHCPNNYKISSRYLGVGGAGALSRDGAAGQAAPTSAAYLPGNGFVFIYEYS